MASPRSPKASPKRTPKKIALAEQAIAKLTELLAQDDSYTLAHLALAVLYEKVGKPEDSVKHGQRACELEPDDPFNFTAMSVTFQRVFAGTNDPKYIQLAEDAMAESRRLESLR